MADWDGLRAGLEGSVTPPPLTALRERRRRRQQRRTIAMTCAVVMVGSASGVALLGRAEQRARDTGPTAAGALDRIVNSDKLPPPRDYEAHVVTDVDFASPAVGVAIGLRCTGDACDVATWRTGDGGRTWSPPSDVATGVPRASFHEEDPAGGAVRSIRMADETTGYAFNPDLYVTRDGGRTWRRVPRPSRVNSVSVQGRTAWFAERGCPAGADCDLVLRTAAAGTTVLRDVRLPETNGAAAVVRRAGELDGYLLAWDAPEAPHAAFHRTRDGGRTWTRGTMPCTDALAASLSAGAGRPLWLVCSTADGRRAFQSDDHGTTWRRLADPPRDGVVTDLVARTATDAYLATQTPGALYVTRDGGATWRPADGVGKAYGYSNLDVADATHAWAMGDAGQLWRTTGGRWERLALPPGAPTATAPPPPRGLREAGVRWTGLSFAGALRGYAVGHRCAAGTCRAVVRATADGGDTWRPLADPPARWPARDVPSQAGYVDRVTFADARHGWLYGRGLYATRDGGATWAEVPGVRHALDAAARGGFVWVVDHESCLPTPCSPVIRRGAAGDELRTLDGYESGHAQGTFAALDDRHAYFAAADDGGGKSPVFAGTADGGATWTAYDRPCATSSTALSAYAPGGLWLVCGAPAHSADSHAPQTLARSADGGRTWTETELPGEGAVVGEIVALSATHAWRTGASYGLLGTTDAGRTWRAVPGVGKATALAFGDARHGWVLSGNVLWRTTDGATWERLG